MASSASKGGENGMTQPKRSTSIIERAQSELRGRVLVIDEDEQAAEMTAQILTAQGHEPTLEASFDGAMFQLDAGASARAGAAFDVVTCDLIPTESGPSLDFIDRLRSTGDGPSVIVTTGHDDVDTAVSALHRGASDYLLKPLDPARLLLAVARALERRRLHNENTRLKRDLVLFTAGQRILETLDAHQLALRGVDALCVFAGANAVAMLGPDVQHHRGLTPEEALALKDIDWPTNWTHRADPQQLSPALANYSDAILLDLAEGRSALLLKRGRTRGPSQFREDDEENALFLARHLSTAFKNVERFLRAELEARRDDLTGLVNAKAFQSAVRDRVHRAADDSRAAKARGELPPPIDFAILFIDLDRFKEVNDVHGHLLGSRLLAEFGHLLTRCVREEDVVGRFGGDEFVILLGAVDPDGAVVVAERIRQKIEDHRFLGREGARLQVTCSIGVAAYEEGQTADALLDRADQAMYLAKSASRNAVRTGAAAPKTTEGT